MSGVISSTKARRPEEIKMTGSPNFSTKTIYFYLTIYTQSHEYWKDKVCDSFIIDTKNIFQSVKCIHLNNVSKMIITFYILWSYVIYILTNNSSVGKYLFGKNGIDRIEKHVFSTFRNTRYTKCHTFFSIQIINDKTYSSLQIGLNYSLVSMYIIFILMRVYTYKMVVDIHIFK